MNLSEQHISDLKKELGSERFNEIVFAVKYNPNNIYLVKSNGYYKLHYHEEKYAWIDLNTSNCLANGNFNSGQEALLSFKDSYKEFSNINKAIESGFFKNE